MTSSERLSVHIMMMQVNIVKIETHHLSLCPLESITLIKGHEGLDRSSHTGTMGN